MRRGEPYHSGEPRLIDHFGGARVILWHYKGSVIWENRKTGTCLVLVPAMGDFPHEGRMEALAFIDMVCLA